MGAMPKFLDPVTGTSTGTVLTLTTGSPKSGSRYLVHGLQGAAKTAGFNWQLKDGTTIVKQGYGLAGADAGFTFGGNKALRMTPGNTVSVVITPNSSDVLVANLDLSEEGPGQ